MSRIVALVSKAIALELYHSITLISHASRRTSKSVLSAECSLARGTEVVPERPVLLSTPNKMPLQAMYDFIILPHTPHDIISLAEPQPSTPYPLNAPQKTSPHDKHGDTTTLKCVQKWSDRPTISDTALNHAQTTLHRTVLKRSTPIAPPTAHDDTTILCVCHSER